MLLTTNNPIPWLCLKHLWWFSPRSKSSFYVSGGLQPKVSGFQVGAVFVSTADETGLFGNL